MQPLLASSPLTPADNPWVGDEVPYGARTPQTEFKCTWVVIREKKSGEDSTVPEPTGQLPREAAWGNLPSFWKFLWEKVKVEVTHSACKPPRPGPRKPGLEVGQGHESKHLNFPATASCPDRVTARPHPQPGHRAQLPLCSGINSSSPQTLQWTSRAFSVIQA